MILPPFESMIANRLHQLIANQWFVFGAGLVFASGVFLFPIFLDQGVFLTGGWLLHEGERLYIDFYDNKPPGIYLWNDLKVSLFSGPVGWDFLDFAMNVFFLLSVWFVLKNGEKEQRPYLLVAFSALAFFPSVYEYGGMTEFYGSFFVLTSLLLYKHHQAFLAGLTIVLSVWFKEPFLMFIFFPLFIPLHSSSRPRYFLGLGTGIFLTLTLFYAGGILPAYWQVYQDNLIYIHQQALWGNLLPRDLTQLVKVLPRFLPLFLALYLGLTKSLSRLAAYFTLAGVVAIVIGQRYYGHYFMFLIPAWLILLQDLTKQTRPRAFSVGVLDLFIIFSLAVHTFVVFLQYPKQKQQLTLSRQIAAEIPANKTLFTEVSNGYLYPLTKVKPQPLSTLVTIMDLYRTSDGSLDSMKVSQTKANFVKAFPDYLYRPEEIFWFEPKWLRHYVEKSIPGLYGLQEPG